MGIGSVTTAQSQAQPVIERVYQALDQTCENGISLGVIVAGVRNRAKAPRIAEPEIVRLEHNLIRFVRADELAEAIQRGYRTVALSELWTLSEQSYAVVAMP